MGVLYIVLPIDDHAKEWLDSEAVNYPKSTNSKLPTLSEIKEILYGLSNCKVTCSIEKLGQEWQASIECSGSKETWTLLVINELKEKQNSFVFEKGSPELIFQIIKNITKYTGALLLVTDSGINPIVITSESNINGFK